ncbi:fimbrial protein [Providencia burhodogranariea]|uniref:Fimbrial subunit n=1 Tax=Providencia burhodogranariea DSM 19968 TaxID=1141662 RepID=K8WD06_9GAMM|nr:fimbrial protein [Providencia burhodogranariea]EKT55337.1 fimbrial subunit [Providencia burhodogranariea DSM 19968]
MNKINKLRYLLLIPFFLGAPLAYSSNTLDVEFNGELIATACQISSKSIKQDVPLYNLRWQFINENGSSAVTPFSIAIDKCSAMDLKKIIKLTWISNKLITVKGDSFIATEGDSNVLLGLVDKDERPIIWNKPMSVGAISVVDNTQQLDFGVFVRKPPTGEAKTGDFSSIIMFNVEYE